MVPARYSCPEALSRRRDIRRLCSLSLTIASFPKERGPIVFLPMAGNQMGCPQRFKFFRVLLPGFTSRLALPHEFTKHFIQGNGKWATLLSRLGKSWHVRIHRDGRNLNLEDGWEKFAADHQLSVGDFLVFKHKGNLVFDVTIFDPSTCERDYSHGSISGVIHDKPPIGEEIPTGEKKNEKESEGSERLAASYGKRAAEAMGPVSSKRPKSREEERREQKGNHENRCSRAPHFEVVMKLPQPHSHYLEIPAAFIAANSLASIPQLFLRDPKGKVWPTSVKCIAQVPRIRLRIRNGWSAFCVANNLEAGNVCVFELKEKNVWHVQVRKNIEERISDP